MMEIKVLPFSSCTVLTPFSLSFPSLLPLYSLRTPSLLPQSGWRTQNQIWNFLLIWILYATIWNICWNEGRFNHQLVKRSIAGCYLGEKQCCHGNTGKPDGGCDGAMFKPAWNVFVKKTFLNWQKKMLRSFQNKQLHTYTYIMNFTPSLTYTNKVKHKHMTWNKHPISIKCPTWHRAAEFSFLYNIPFL